jgi:hypothetical protein
MKNILAFALLLAVLSACNTTQKCVEKINTDCVCTMQYDPVCGCNNKTYGNACVAECSGIKTYTKGECPQDATVKLEGTKWQLVTFAVSPAALASACGCDDFYQTGSWETGRQRWLQPDWGQLYFGWKLAHYLPIVQHQNVL